MAVSSPASKPAEDTSGARHRALAAALSSVLSVLLAACTLAWSSTAHADLPPPVLRALQTAQIPPTQVAVIVQPVDRPGPIISHNAQLAMNPASVMKLVTTYAALDLLGPAWTWKTTLASPASTVDGTLDGDLYLKGSGAPNFAIEHLTALLRQLRTRGIRHIAGDIVLDRTVFDLPAIDPGAFDDKPMRPYNVGPDGLLINFRALAFTLQADSGQPRLLQETPHSELRIDNRLRTVDAPCGSDWKDLINTRLIPEGNANRLEFSGSYSSQCGDRTLNLAPLNADAYASGLIRAIWQELGGTLGGRIRPGKQPANARLLATQESASLTEAIRDINKFSNNVMARQLFLSLGNDSAPATVDRARRRVSDWLAARQMNFAELQLDNGSGLSRSERISAASLNRLLLDAWRHPAMPEFIASLPIVGVDGTMKKRLAGSTSSGRAHIKTGTLDGVKTAAGYALDADGKLLALAFFINHPRAAAGAPAIDALLAWLAQRSGSDLQRNEIRP